MSSKLIDHNPMLKKPAFAMLEVCGEHAGQSRLVIEEAASAVWQSSYNQTPSAIIDALVRTGYLDEQITVDGVPYDGALEDVYKDDSVSDEADVDALLSVTESGAQLLVDYAPEATLQALVEEKPAYAPVFKAVLEACSAADGVSRLELEEMIEAVLAQHSITGADGQKIYPQYFIDALETAGGIAWDGAWRATDAGASVEI